MVDDLTPLAQLGVAFRFSSDDLRANREGKMTLRQRRIAWQRFWSTVIVFILLIMIPIMLAWGLLLWESDKSINDVMTDSAATIGYVTGIVLAIFYITVSYERLLLIIDTLRGRVAKISGSVERYGRYVYIKNRRFLLDSDKLELIQNGLQYTLYILPMSHQILSIEFAE